MLLERGTLIDTAGRRFENVTALQYAQWALDMNMSFMIIKNIPEGEEEIAIKHGLLKQDKSRQKGGITYSLCRAKIIFSEPTEAEKQQVINRKEFLLISTTDYIEIA